MRLLQPGAGRTLANVAEQHGCWGHCRRCDVVHSLPRTAASDAAALTLVHRIKETGRLDFDAAVADARLSADTKYRSAAEPRRQGQMLGVLLAADRAGATHVLKAFSGQLNFIWSVQGWAPSLSALRHDTPGRAYGLAFRRIAQLSGEAAAAALADDEELRIRARRAQKAVSNALLSRIRAATLLPNWRGELQSVEQASLAGTATSGGTGDCAAPKLLAAAARAELAPLAISEVWFGSGPPAGGREEGLFYAACAERCQPIMGYMLCGARERSEEYEPCAAG